MVSSFDSEGSWGKGLFTKTSSFEEPTSDLTTVENSVVDPQKVKPRTTLSMISKSNPRNIPKRIKNSN